MTGRVRIACNASNKGVKTKGTVLSAIAIDSNPSLTPPTSTTIFKCQAHNTRSPPFVRGGVTLTFIPHLTLLYFEFLSQSDPFSSSLLHFLSSLSSSFLVSYTRAHRHRLMHQHSDKKGGRKEWKSG